VEADVACADDVEIGKIVGAMVGEHSADGIEHLQKKVPDQVMSFFDSIEK